MSEIGMTEEEFWAALAPVPVAPEPVYKLYYGEHGELLFYSMEDLPGNYIEIDREIFLNSASNIRVVDGQITVIKGAIVHKLTPDESGTACHPVDVAIVVDEAEPNTKWSLK